MKFLQIDHGVTAPLLDSDLDATARTRRRATSMKKVWLSVVVVTLISIRRVRQSIQCSTP